MANTGALAVERVVPDPAAGSVLSVR
ncbi:MAG: hypothetical protein K0R85_1945, partial [Devosia sp.]|nr:hypothetical protein [Devosia sp.]